MKNNKGQSTIEFILTFTAAVGFIFLFLKMAINYTNGYMVHHATYMASRSYLVGDAERYGEVSAGDEPVFRFATKIFKKYLPEQLISNFDGTLKENSPSNVNFSAFVGVWTEFHQVFSLGFIGGKDQVVYRSESFLGREPTRNEVFTQICSAISTVTMGGAGHCDIHATLDDNGG